jgi:hypothetical protein
MNARATFSLIRLFVAAATLLQPVQSTLAQFAEIKPGLAEPPFPCLAVGDYDGDGDISLCLAGHAGDHLPRRGFERLAELDNLDLPDRRDQHRIV